MADVFRTLFSIQETAKRFGKSTHTIRRQISGGYLKSVNIGASVMIPLKEIERVEQFGVGEPRKRRNQPASGIAASDGMGA